MTWQAVKTLLDIFSLRMRRNGYLGALGQKSYQGQSISQGVSEVG